MARPPHLIGVVRDAAWTSPHVGPSLVTVPPMRIPDFAAWTPADWSAAAAWATFLVALIAAVIAFREYHAT